MLIVIIIVIGLAIGSFLNAVIFRLYKGEPIFFRRSHCPHCSHELAFLDLVPLFSFIALQGKCRYCRRPISWQYPLVELTTAAVFVLFFVNSQLSIVNSQLWFQLIFLCFLIVIAVYDFQHYLILDKVVVPAFILAIFWNLFFDFFVNSQLSIVNSQFLSGLLGAAVVAGFFGLQFLFSSGRWIGLGDVKLGLFLGVLLGFSQSLVLLVIAYTLGAVVGLTLILLGQKSFKSRLPFGTFLATSAIIVMLYGEAIVGWYLSLIGY